MISKKQLNPCFLVFLLILFCFGVYDYTDAQEVRETESISTKALAAYLALDAIEVEGRGHSRTIDRTIGQKRASAEEAARAVGQVKLAETLGGLIISGEKTISVQEIQDEVFHLEMEEYRLRYARQVGKTNFEELKDGSIEATLKMQIPLKPLRGAIGKVLSEGVKRTPPKPAHANREEVESLKKRAEKKQLETDKKKLLKEIAELQDSLEKGVEELGDAQKQFEQYKSEAKRTTKRLEKATTAVERTREEFEKLLQKRKQLLQKHPKAKRGEFTGLIVDTKGLHVKPGVASKIYTQTGTELYGYFQVIEEVWKRHGMVKYAKSVEQAKKIYYKRLGTKTLIVKAVSVRGKTKSEVVVSDDDAVAIFAANVKYRFLEAGKVVFVVD